MLPIRYQLSFNQIHAHLIDIEMRFTAQPEQKLWLPTWINGSYLIREFARHIGTVNAYKIEQGIEQPLVIHKVTKNQWQMTSSIIQDIIIRYQVYAYDLSVRGAYIDNERIYINPACVCLAVYEQEHYPIKLSITLNNQFKPLTLACTLPVQMQYYTHEFEYKLSANNYHELIDHPLEIAQAQTAIFTVKEIVHKIIISGKHTANLVRLTQDLQKICQTEIELFGDAPFSQYLFMVMATAQHYGGLEHANCTSLITPRDDLPTEHEGQWPSSNYMRFLGLCSHEYFHAWLVKMIRPEGYTPPQLHNEQYTPLLWIFEGFTSYYDDLILYRSDIIQAEHYIKLLNENLNRYFSNLGRHKQTLTESSFDAWIKFYRPDENSNNAGISYYNQGGLLALCLDLMLHEQGCSLDNVMRLLYQQAKQGQTVNSHTLAVLCQQITQHAQPDYWQKWLRLYTETTQALPLLALLQKVGIKSEAIPNTLPFGLKVTDHAQGLLVQSVVHDSIAAKAGLWAHDVLIAIDGLHVNQTLLKRYEERARLKHSVKGLTLHFFRRDELKQLQLNGDYQPFTMVQLAIADSEKLLTWLKAYKTAQ